MSANARVAYLWSMLVLDIVFLAIAIGTPVWVTPGYYWWTAFALLSLIGQSHAFNKRVNSWGDLGRYDP